MLNICFKDKGYKFSLRLGFKKKKNIFKIFSAENFDFFLLYFNIHFEIYWND